MWPFSLLRNFLQKPAVGQTRRGYIGCYLFGVVTTGEEDATYHSLATSRDQLLQDCRSYLQGFVDEAAGNPASQEEVRAVQALLDQLETRIDAHLQTDMQAPLLVLGPQELFLRTGLRSRRQEKGRYVE